METAKNNNYAGLYLFKGKSVLPVQVTKIKMAQKHLGIDDDTYREMLFNSYLSRSGKPALSCTALSREQADHFIEVFKNLGWNDYSDKFRKKLKYDEFKSRKDFTLATPAQMRKIDANWSIYSREKKDSSMNKFIKRITGVDNITWLRKEDVSKVLKAIESLGGNKND